MTVLKQLEYLVHYFKEAQHFSRYLKNDNICCDCIHNENLKHKALFSKICMII